MLPGIERVCRDLSAVPLVRNIGISWADFTLFPGWEIRRALQSLAILLASCLFHLKCLNLDLDDKVSIGEFVSNLT